MNPVFIIGCQRTGTTMLASILNLYSEIDIMPEMHILAPFWLHKDFVYKINKTVGDLQKDENIPRLVNLIHSKQLFGIFWKSFDLDTKIIEKQIMDSDRSIKSIFQILLLEHCKSRNKLISGAKFPVHFSYINILLEWFPKCKIIHTIRDVRGIYSSQANKYILKPTMAKESDKLNKYQTGSRFKNSLLRLQMLVFICLQFSWAAKIHKKAKNLPNYKLLRYEDIVLQPEKSLKNICNFLKIDFKEEMLYPKVINSTYEKAYKCNKGFNRELVCRWKKYVSPLTGKFLMMINRKAMRIFGYSES